MNKNSIALIVALFIGLTPSLKAQEASPSSTDRVKVRQPAEQLRFLQIAATTAKERTELSNLGFSIEFVRSDSAWGFATPSVLKAIEQSKFKILGNFPPETARGGHQTLDFPAKDARFHNYKELTDALKKLAEENSNAAKMVSIGKSTEGREMWALHLNSNPDDLASGQSSKPGIVFMGTHHAREHVSTEIPLMLADYILKIRRSLVFGPIFEDRDIWIIPLVNPDGAEFDVDGGEYHMWRKNRRDNGDGTYGVDLNRNYGEGWGTGGSSKDTSSEIYMGPSAFSEPETIAVRKFVDDHKNFKMLLSFHTFSELILYPWGGKYEPVKNEQDHKIFESMGSTMAAWNKYKAEQSSKLYIASGDTTDWAYATHGIFAFTFELSPATMWSGGFYPGAGILDKVFEDNLRPALYMIDVTNDPKRAITSTPPPEQKRKWWQIWKKKPKPAPGTGNPAQYWNEATLPARK